MNSGRRDETAPRGRVEEPCGTCVTAYSCLQSGVCRDAATLRSAVDELRAVTRKHDVQMPSVEEHLSEYRENQSADRTPEGRPLINTPLWDACAVVIATARAIPAHHVEPRMVDRFWDAVQRSGAL